MKRGPVWGERALVHVTLNTGDRQRFALVPENYDPSAIAQLRAALPKVPGFADWEIARTGPQVPGGESNSSSCEFWVYVRGQAVSRNRVTRHGETLVLETALLTPWLWLRAKDLAALADLEQCTAIVLLMEPEANQGRET
jgi:hypothetical protein